MLNSLQQALNAYMKQPLFFIFNSFMYAFFQLLVILAIGGVLLLGFFTASTLRQSVTSVPLLFFYAFLLVAFFYFSSALFGSLLRAYWNALAGRPTDFLDFYRYALDNGFRFFWIFVIKLAIEMVLLLPLVLLYLFVLKTVVFPYRDPLIALAAFGIMFFVGFLFHGAFIASALYDFSANQAIKSGFSFLRRRHIIAFIFFGIYAFVWLTNAIPLVDLISLFVTLPVVLTGLMLFFDNALDKGR